VLVALALASGVAAACADSPGAEDDEDDSAGAAGAESGGTSSVGGAGGSSAATGGAGGTGGSGEGGEETGSGGSSGTGGASGGTGGSGGGTGGSGGTSGGTGGSGGTNGGTGGTGGTNGGAGGTGGAGGAAGGSGGASGGTGGSGGTSASAGGGGASGSVSGGTGGATGGTGGTAGAGSTASLEAALRHRYSFEGTGTAVVSDSVGTAHGTVVNGLLVGMSAVILNGGTSDQFVDLPNGLVSPFEAVTLEAWVIWTGGTVWQRIFDFGNTVGGEGTQAAEGLTYVFLSPSSNPDGYLRAVTSLNGPTQETLVSASAPLTTNSIIQLAVVMDGINDLFLLYQDGVLIQSTSLAISPRSIVDQNCWLGRSQFVSDPEFQGSIEEFRIYGAALSGSELALSAASGPDPAFLAD